jgi:polyisoprenyl-phosphate glycosyltransferase
LLYLGQVMSSKSLVLLSIVIPAYNEQVGLVSFNQELLKQLNQINNYDFEIIYCNDGSTDQTLSQLKSLAAKEQSIQIVSLTRNFGKEIATTAGITRASGSAVITIDADGQHPVDLIPELIKEWESGAKVVIGLRTDNQREGLVKRIGSKIFYKVFNTLTGLPLVAGATDFRLIDEVVQGNFVKLTEHNRITRGLIDWLGYNMVYISFSAKPRLHDQSGYSFGKLFKLSIDSVISMSSSPLYITAYIGAIILPLSFLLGLVMFIDGLIGDPLNWNVTGGAYVTVLILFLIGILMASQGIIGLYLSHIHSETQNRPLYIVDNEASVLK